MSREEEIQKIAYHMWDLEGRPEGRSLEYWVMAESIWEINHLKETAEKKPDEETPKETKQNK